MTGLIPLTMFAALVLAIIYIAISVAHDLTDFGDDE